MSEFIGNLRIKNPAGERVVRLSLGSLVIGRAASCDIRINDARVSRRHLSIELSTDSAALSDLNSSLGTTVNGIRVDNATLADGSVVQLGDTELTFELPNLSTAGEEYFEINAGEEEPTLVETLRPGELTISYAGTQQVFADTSQPRIVVFNQTGTREYILEEGLTTLGRDPACDIVVDDPAASREHAVLERHGRQIVLRDRDSKNGTFLRAKPIKEQALFNGVNFRIGQTFIVYKAGFSAAELSENSEPGAERQPVVVLPGIMGSELYNGDRLHWPNLRQTLRNAKSISIGRGDTLRLGNIVKEIIVIPGVIKLDAYSELVDYLETELGYESGKDLLVFPYDWRQDNRDSAEKLKHAIDRWRREVIGEERKFKILAHSMGALVSRYYLNCLGGSDHVSKLVTLGGAHFGAPFAVQTLMHGPDLLPLGLGRKNLHAALMTMPAIYQLVPPYEVAYDPSGAPINLHEEDSWVNEEYRHLLRSARDFHDEIGSTTTIPTTCIFGYGVKTVTRIDVGAIRQDASWDKVKFTIEPAGDNRVVDKYGYLEGADIHPVRQHHGSLWNDNDVKMRIKLELLGAGK